MNMESGSSENDLPAEGDLNIDSARHKTVIHKIELHPQVLLFMKITASYWPEWEKGDSEWKLLYRAYFLLVRGILLFSVAYSLYLFCIEVERGELVGTTISLTFFLDIASVLPAQYFNQIRLQRIAFDYDCAAFDVCTSIAQRFTIACMLMIATSVVFGTLAYDRAIADVALTISEACVTIYLSFNLWFLLLDLQVSSEALDDLLALAGNRQLDLVRFNAVRDDIHRRVRESKWVSDFILLPCVASVISIVVLMFHLQPDLEQICYTIGWIAALTKEMLFICVAFWFVAAVNQKADALTEKLSCEVWSPAAISAVYSTNSSSLGGSHHGGANTPNTRNKAETGEVTVTPFVSAMNDEETGSADAQHTHLHPHMNDQAASSLLLPVSSDIERLTMCVSSLTRPISFTLLFKRVSWQNVVVSFAGVALTIGIGLARSLILEF